MVQKWGNYVEEDIPEEDNILVEDHPVEDTRRMPVQDVGADNIPSALEGDNTYHSSSTHNKAVPTMIDVITAKI